MTVPSRRAVFLDRDGVLNQAVVREGKPYPPGNLAELKITPGAAGALGRLREAGFLLLVVTNQPDVARGTQSVAGVEAIHQFLGSVLPIDDFLVCYHEDCDDCLCRKPRPGLLQQGAMRYDVDLTGSYMVGDRWRDVDAGRAAGCRTVFLDLGYLEPGPTHIPDAVVYSLAEAANWIIGRESA